MGQTLAPWQNFEAEAGNSLGFETFDSTLKRGTENLSPYWPRFFEYNLMEQCIAGDILARQQLCTSDLSY